MSDDKKSGLVVALDQITADNADEQLALDMGRFFADPLGWVMYSFPWTTNPLIQRVPLPEPWRSRYNSEYGPDKWACEYLDDLGQRLRAQAAAVKRGEDVIPVLIAVASGHGIGKSTIVAWLVLFFMSTRPYCRLRLTADTLTQLETTTWAELSMWYSLCVTRHWFELRDSLILHSKQHKKVWFSVGLSSAEKNYQSFAGQHAAMSSSVYIFDEASNISDKIYEVALGGMTDGMPVMLLFGNPNKNEGAFFDCFHKNRHRWKTWQIDSRSVYITNKTYLGTLVEDNGEDSDIVRVRVRGVFPRASIAQFIGRDVVDTAAKNGAPYQAHGTRIAIIGVDVALFGDDSSVIAVRVGLDARSVPWQQFRGVDDVQLTRHIIAEKRRLASLGYQVIINVDAIGIGWSVVSNLRQANHDCNAVNWSIPAADQTYLNLRAESWGLLRDWLKEGGAIPNDEELATDLTCPKYYYTAKQQIQLESKKDIKARGMPSPDKADALALTFSVPVNEVIDLDADDYHSEKSSVDYEPTFGQSWQ